MRVILVYERALSVFPTFFFLISFLIMSAVYYNRYMTEESDSRATSYYRDYIIVMNSQSAMVSVINGLIIIVLYNDIIVGVVMALITQALSTYVFVALHMKSHYDSLFFLAFSVLAYLFEFLFFLFSGTTSDILGRTMGGLEIAIFWFIVIILCISAILAIAAVMANRHPDEKEIV